MAATYRVRVYPYHEPFFLPPDLDEAVVGLVAAKRRAKALVQERQNASAPWLELPGKPIQLPVCVAEVVGPTGLIAGRYYWMQALRRSPAGAYLRVYRVGRYEGSISRNMKPQESA